MRTLLSKTFTPGWLLSLAYLSPRPLGYCAGLLLGLGACDHPLPCEEDNRRTYHPIELRLIVTDKGSIGTACNLEGIDAVTHKKAGLHTGGAFYIAVKDAIALGDTVVKDKGTSVFLIKKQNYNIRVTASCDEIGPTDAYGYAPTTTDTIPKSALTD